MTLQRADRVFETSVTTGTGTYALAGAVVGYRAFSTICSNNDTVEYVATDGVNWEIGLGTWTTGNSLARTSVYASSNANAAVNWTTGTRNIWLDIPAHFFNTSTGSGNLVFATSPTLNQPNLVGTTTNNNAAAGSVGEYVTSVVLTPGSSISTGTAINVTSISLTAGDWDVRTAVAYAASTSSPAFTYIMSSANTTSATSQTQPDVAVSVPKDGIGSNPCVVGPTVRYSLSTTTTIYLVAQTAFGSGTMTAYGRISARRVR